MISILYKIITNSGQMAYHLCDYMYKYDNATSSYEAEIEFNDILGDIQIYDASDECDYDLKCEIKSWRRGYITREELDIFEEMMYEYLEEFQMLRINEYSKWYQTN